MDINCMENKFESLILVNNKSKLAAVCKLYNRLSMAQKKPLILATCDNINFDKEYFVKRLKGYQEIFKIDYHYIRTETYNLFYSLANKEMHNCTDLRGLTTYGGVSLWELSAVRIFSELTILLYDINIADAILNY